jgi:hypothetical protein
MVRGEPVSRRQREHQLLRKELPHLQPRVGNRIAGDCEINFVGQHHFQQARRGVFLHHDFEAGKLIHETRHHVRQQIGRDGRQNADRHDAPQQFLRVGCLAPRDARGNTLLMLASYNGNAETARMLLEHGAAADRRNDRGQTPLGGVAFRGYEQIVTLLLEHGADIDADNGGGMTPLMYAAMFGRARVAAQLQARGASLRRRNRFGISAERMVRLSSWVTRLLRGRSPGRSIPERRQET